MLKRNVHITYTSHYYSDTKIRQYQKVILWYNYTTSILLSVVVHEVNNVSIKLLSAVLLNNTLWAQVNVHNLHNASHDLIIVSYVMMSICDLMTV